MAILQHTRAELVHELAECLHREFVLVELIRIPWVLLAVEAVRNNVHLQSLE